MAAGPSPAYSQATTQAGAIQGTVTDPTGALVAGARVTITETAKGSQRVLVTSSAGLYSSEALEPGPYTIQIEATGFSAAKISLVVQVGQTANGSVKLALAGTTTEVQVEDTAVQVDTSSSTVQGVLNRQEIETLPLNGRNFLDMAQLQPGVQIQDGTSFDPTKNGFSSISFGGRFGRTARITMDGIDISDENVGTTTQNVSEDAIQEFQIAESSLDISTSLTSSGSVNIVTRSGANKVHADGFYNFRDQRAGNAEPVGYTPIPGVDADYLQRHNQGGSLGGPFKTDKLFYFTQYEHFRQNVFNPVIFGGPLASVDGGYPVKFRETMALGRLDWSGPHDMRAFFRWNYNNNSDVAAFGGSNYSPFLNRDNTPGFGGGVDFASTHFTHSIRGGYFKFVNHITDATAGSGIYNPTPGINLVIAPFGFSSGANLLAPQATVQSNKQGKYDGSWVHGSHTVRFGGGVNHMLGGGYASFFGLAPQVTVNVNNCAILQAAEAGPFPAIGSSAIQDTADGCGGTYGAATNPMNYAAGAGGANLVIFGNGEGYFTEIPQFGFPGGGQGDWRINFYGSDTWKFRKLTINYGLRYIRDTGRDDADLPPIPLLDTLLPHLGDTPSQPNKNFGPQAGFVYDFKGNGKTVIRAGAGIYYENNVWNNVLFDRPAKLTQGLFFGTAAYCPSGAAWCGQPVGNVYQQIAADQAAFQKATAAAGPQNNGEYIGNTMAVPATLGLSLFAPNYKTPSSYQMNLGVQRELHPGMVFSADYVRSVGVHSIVGIDVNHVGDAQYLNLPGAEAAILSTLAMCGAGNIDAAIQSCPNSSSGTGHATIFDFASNGLDSENAIAGGFPGANAAFAGMNTDWGQVLVLYPSGRSVYDGLDLSLQAQIRHVSPGLNGVAMQTAYTYSHYNATGTTAGGDADFGGNALDFNHPTQYFGPTALDRHNQFSIGVTANTFAGFDFNTIAHLYSSLPTNLTLPTVGAADIFLDDVSGDGTTGDLVPGTNVGAFNRKFNGASINRLISSYNAQVAGKPSPQGQALINAGLFTSTELTQLGGVLESLQPAPPNQASNDILRTWDITLGRTIKVWGERISIRPTFSAFNVLNAVNYNNRTGNNGANVIGGALNGQPGSPNGTPGHIAEQNFRVSAGSGVYAEGSPRQMEYSLKISF